MRCGPTSTTCSLIRVTVALHTEADPEIDHMTRVELHQAQHRVGANMQPKHGVGANMQPKAWGWG